MKFGRPLTIIVHYMIQFNLSVAKKTLAHTYNPYAKLPDMG